MRALALILALSVASCASDFDASALDIRGDYDPGGRVDSYAALVDQFNASHVPLRISGECDSACTMKLAIKGVCIEPTAVLGFHAATHYFGQGAQVLVESYVARGAPRVYQYAASRGWFGSSEIHEMRGAQAIALGVPGCK